MKWKCDSGSHKDRDLYEKQKMDERFKEEESMPCDKCLSSNPIQATYAYAGLNRMEKVSLCAFCDNVFNTNLLPEFMKEDFGVFPISEISKHMINARRKRASGESPWQK